MHNQIYGCEKNTKIKINMGKEEFSNEYVQFYTPE